MKDFGLSQIYICISGYVVNNGLYETVFKEHKAENDAWGDFTSIQFRVKFTVSFYSSSLQKMGV